MAQIVIVDGPDTGHSFAIGEHAIIGTDPTNEVVLSDRRASERHSTLQMRGDQYEIQNLDSTRKIFVNTEPTTQRVLHHGDMITIGNSKLLFSQEDPATPDHDRDISDATNAQLVEGQVLSHLGSIQDTDTLFLELETADEQGRRLLALYKVSQVLHGELDLDSILAKLTQILFEEFPADRILILIAPGEEKSFDVQFAWDRSRGRVEEPIRYSRTIVSEVMKSREAILTANAMDDQRFDMKQSIVDQSIVSALCVPLVRRGHSFGVIQLDTSNAERAFNNDDLEQLTKIGFQCAVAIQNSLTYSEPQQDANTLKSLSRATRQLSRYLDDRGAILNEGISYACCLLGCRDGSIMLASARTKNLHVITSFNRSIKRGIQSPIDRGLSGWVYSNNRPLIHPSKDGQFALPDPLKPTHRDRYQTDSFMILPIHRTAQDGEESQVIGVLNVTDKIGGANFSSTDLKVLQVLVAQIGIALTNARLYEKATVDSLTRLYVRRFFFDRLKDELRVESDNDAPPLSLLMLDLDNFKSINDNHGHPAGDLILRETGRIIRSCCRDSDIAARYGGEELAILLPGTPPQTALEVAERIRKAIEDHVFATKEEELKITVSIGLAGLQAQDTRDSLLGRADKALYEAKKSGKNRVESKGTELH